MSFWSSAREMAPYVGMLVTPAFVYWWGGRQTLTQKRENDRATADSKTLEVMSKTAGESQQHSMESLKALAEMAKQNSEAMGAIGKLSVEVEKLRGEVEANRKEIAILKVENARVLPLQAQVAGLQQQNRELRIVIAEKDDEIESLLVLWDATSRGKEPIQGAVEKAGMLLDKYSKAHFERKHPAQGNPAQAEPAPREDH